MKLETETSAFKTIEAYKSAAAEAGLVLRPPEGSDSGDFPDHAYTNLRYIRRVDALGKEHRKLIRTMSRQLVTLKENGKFVKKEYLTYMGEFRVTDHRGLEFGAEFEIGKFQKPKIVPNGNLRYSPETGLPIGNPKILSGKESVYTIPVPDKKDARKKLVDSIISENENHSSAILYYYRELDQNNYEQSRDASFTHQQFTDLSIEELRDLSQKGAGGKSSPYYKDREGQLRDKKTNTPVSKGNEGGAYQ